MTAAAQGPPGDAGARERSRRGTRVFPVFAGLFLVLALFVAEDIVADVAAGFGGGLHMVLETVSLAVALVGLAAATREFYGAVRRVEALQGDLQRTRADVERWRGEAEALLARLGAALDQRFAAWGLTDAEREVAVQVLKGLSYKEIACARGTSERTVRHQALTVYRKAGVAGRAELAGRFLEALTSPVRLADAQDPDGDSSVGARSATSSRA